MMGDCGIIKENTPISYYIKGGNNMNKTWSEENMGFFEDLFFKHCRNEDTGMFERDDVCVEAVVFIVLIILIVILAL